MNKKLLSFCAVALFAGQLNASEPAKQGRSLGKSVWALLKELSTIRSKDKIEVVNVKGVLAPIAKTKNKDQVSLETKTTDNKSVVGKINTGSVVVSGKTDKGVVYYDLLDPRNPNLNNVEQEKLPVVGFKCDSDGNLVPLSMNEVPKDGKVVAYEIVVPVAEGGNVVILQETKTLIVTPEMQAKHETGTEFVDKLTRFRLNHHKMNAAVKSGLLLAGVGYGAKKLSDKLTADDEEYDATNYDDENENLDNQ